MTGDGPGERATRQPPPPHRLVVASAGTGKTYRLTVELLRRLLEGARPEEVLAVTFTRKAAGEILERVLVRLAEACLEREAREQLGRELGSDLTMGEVRALLGVVVDSLDRVQISTLDAFFHRMLLGFRVELGMTAVPLVLPPEDPRAVALRSRTLGRLLDEMAEADFTELLGLLDRLREGRARRPVVRDLGRLLEELQSVLREAPERARWLGAVDSMAPLSHEDLDRVLSDLRELGLHPMPKGVRSAWRRDLSEAEAGHWHDLLGSGLAAKVLAGERHYRRWRIPHGVLAAYQPVVEHARRVLLSRVGARTQASYDLVRHYDGLYTDQMARAAVVLFGDVAHRLAHDMPSLHPERLGEVYYRLDSSVSHLLLDEFQDTSLDQWRVIEPFADEIWAYGDGSRSFFCVGDPKQAIYGWRGGCAALFDLVEERLTALGSGVESLQRNYRSSPVILAAVETVFEGLRDRVDEARSEATADWLRDFVPVEAAHPGRSGHVVLELVAGASGDGEDGAAGKAEAMEDDDPAEADEESEDGDLERPLFGAVADRVQALQESRPEAQIGVLVRTNRTASQLLDALRRRGLSASGEGGGVVTDDPAVTVILAALQLAEHPADRAAVFHVATSPLGEVLGLLPLDDGLALSKRLRALVQARGLARVVADLAEQLASSVDRKSAVRLAQLLDLARRFEAAGGAELGTFVEWARTAKVEEPQAARVRVMTVHRAKGLEFDAVVLCELERRPTTPGERVVWLDRPSPTEPPRQVVGSVDARVRALDPELERAYRQEMKRLQMDDLSALYVALTRARQALHLLVERPTARRLPDGSWASRLITSLAPEHIEETLVSGGSPGAGLRLYESGESDWALERPPTSTVAPRQPALPVTSLADVRAPSARQRFRRPRRNGEDAASALRTRDWLRLDSEEGRTRGTLYHAWLASIEWLPEGADWEESLPGRERLLASGRRLVPGSSRSWLEQRFEDWREVLRRPGVRASLTRPVVAAGQRLSLWRERSYAIELGGRVELGRFDRVSMLSEATSGEMLEVRLWDFKSEHPSGDAMTRSAIEQVQLAQLASYRKALEEITGVEPERIEARVLYLDTGQTVELPARGAQSRLEGR